MNCLWDQTYYGIGHIKVQIIGQLVACTGILLQISRYETWMLQHAGP